MRVALLHDYLSTFAGAERCLEALVSIFPTAPIYTLFHHPERLKRFNQADIRCSFLNRLPGIKTNHEIYFWLYPSAVESLELRDFDLIVSVSWGWLKGVKKSHGTCHICHCCTPLRFAHEDVQEYIGFRHPAVRPFIRASMNYIRSWDKRTAARPDYFIANSRHTQARIKRTYGRDSTVIHSPVDAGLFTPGDEPRSADYFLVVSRLVHYKRVELAVAACNDLSLPLKVVGDGPRYRTLKKMCGPTVELVGRVSDTELVDYYRSCRALIMPQKEDWGIVSLEAQCCEKPVIAFRQGGAAEHVVPNKTGVFFEDQTVEALIDALQRFEACEFSSKSIREQVLEHDVGQFRTKLDSFIREKYKEFQSSSANVV